jgi:two-component system, LytTR family, sensor kinase
LQPGGFFMGIELPPCINPVETIPYFAKNMRLTLLHTASEKRKELIRDWFTIPFVGGVLLALIFEYDDMLKGEFKEFFQMLTLNFTLWNVLANGNSWIIKILDKHWSWFDQPGKRAAIGIIVLIVYTIGMSTVIFSLYFETIEPVGFMRVVEHYGLMRLLRIPMAITVFFALWGHGRGFLMAWRQAAVDIERLKTENMKTKFESLRNQVNPHFLFNSLNALSSLVYNDQDKANQFIQKLSEVYRYVLDHQNDELVPLNEELEFLKSYVYLNTIRFGQNLMVDFSGFDEPTNQWNMPPVSLQMLLENALKHNEISKGFPLHVSVRKENGSVVMENNLNPIPDSAKDSSKLGLENIRSRYQLLTDKKVKIEKTDTHFRVTLPLLQVS